MNWLGDLVQKQLESDDSVLDLGCGIMQSILDTCQSYPATRLRCKQIVGVDIYDKYFPILENKGIITVKWDLRETPLPFGKKSSDVVLLLDVLEHLESQKQAENLLVEVERIAQKKIIVLTPTKFYSNMNNATKEVYPYTGLGVNCFQRHNILYSERELRERGFWTRKVRNKNVYAIKNLQKTCFWDWVKFFFLP